MGVTMNQSAYIMFRHHLFDRLLIDVHDFGWLIACFPAALAAKVRRDPLSH